MAQSTWYGNNSLAECFRSIYGRAGGEEIAAPQQQIKDKQKRIALLMRLFVDDEKEFLMNPADGNSDPVVAERWRYEQDELRWETVELGK